MTECTSNEPSEKPSYLARPIGFISEISGEPYEDGQRLAQECRDELAKVGNLAQFPPKLLILLVSGSNTNEANARHLLAGINVVFRMDRHTYVPLIGCTVAGILFNNEVHETGALLVCLASRALKASVAHGENARNNEKKPLRMFSRNWVYTNRILERSLRLI